MNRLLLHILKFSPALLAALAAAAAGPAVSSGPSAHHSIIISIDGLIPASYTEPDARGLKIPTLRQLAATGAFSPGVRVGMPAVTYPSHTSMVTGVWPARHGIVTNTVFDPDGKRDGEWYWYTSEIRVPTLWSLAREKGVRTSMIGWPVTMGARADALVPEFWRGRGIDGPQLLQAISSPGLWEAVARRFPGFDAAFSVLPPKDEAFTDIAVDVIERERPDLLLLHLSVVDHWQHEKGPWSPEANAAIETADAQVARVIEAARHAGTLDRTLLLVVSDHGFARQEKVLRPSALLREAGLIALDAQNRVASWRAQAATFGGGAYIYLHDANDADAAARVSGLFTPLAGRPGSGIGRMLSREQIAGLGGDPKAFLALEAADGFGFAGGVAGDAISPAATPGIHGFPPDNPSMNASLLITGPGVRRGRIEGARLVDIAPTVARWLGLTMKDIEGRPLDAVPADKSVSRPQ